MFALAASLLTLVPVFPQNGPETLLPSIQREKQAFGAQVVALDDQLIASAPTQRANLVFERGTVYAYTTDSTTGLQEVNQLIEPSIDLPNMFFGAAMVGEGSTLVVGAPEPRTSSGGKVFVFLLDPITGIWNEAQILDVPNSARFGAKLVLEQGRLFVVERRENVDDLSRIHEYVQDPATGQFLSVRQTDIPRELVEGASGVVESLAFIAPDTLIVGDARFETESQFLSGGILVLQLNPITNAYEVASVTRSPQRSPFASFGSTLAWDGTHLLVGEPRFFIANGVPTVGRVHVFSHTPTAGLSFLQTLEEEAPGSTPSNEFGYVLAANDGRALISSRTCCTSGTGLPTLHLFERDGITGLFDETVSTTTVTNIGAFSFGDLRRPVDSGAINGDRLVWGYSSGNSGFVSPHGRVFVFDGGINAFGVGSAFCSPAVPNSTGQPGQLSATGSLSSSANNFTIEAAQLPANTLTLLLASEETAVTFPASSQGAICLGGDIGRFLGLVQATDANGTATFSLDLNDLPPIINTGPTLRGAALHFQAWHRDNNPTPTSNFTDALRAVFEN